MQQGLRKIILFRYWCIAEETKTWVGELTSSVPGITGEQEYFLYFCERIKFFHITVIDFLQFTLSLLRSRALSFYHPVITLIATDVEAPTLSGCYVSSPSVMFFLGGQGQTEARRNTYIRFTHANFPRFVPYFCVTTSMRQSNIWCQYRSIVAGWLERSSQCVTMPRLVK